MARKNSQETRRRNEDALVNQIQKVYRDLRDARRVLDRVLREADPVLQNTVGHGVFVYLFDLQCVVETLQAARIDDEEPTPSAAASAGK